MDGTESLLVRLKAAGVEMHAFSNYPVWYRLVEEKLLLSRFLEWSFVSCHMVGRRGSRLNAHTSCPETECSHVGSI